MLKEFSLRNVGVISEARAELAPGLTVITGETGAGKTMFVSSLRLLSGARADASRVRSGATTASIEGAFSPDQLPEAAQQSLTEFVSSVGGELDENGEYLAVRTVSAQGRSRAYLGGRSVPASVLGEFAAQMITIHGQNDQLRLLSADAQREALDRYQPEILPLLEKYQRAYRKFRGLSRDLKERTARRRELAQEADRLEFAIEEIEKVAPVAGEDLELQQQISRLLAVDGLRDQAVLALVNLDGSEALDFNESSSASLSVATAARALVGAEDEKLQELHERLEEIVSSINEVSMELSQYVDALPSDPEELERSLQRQQALKQLTRKYAPDIEGVLVWLGKAKHKLAGIDVSPEALEKLQEETQAAEKAMLKAGAALSKARAKAADKLAKAVTEEVRGLAMPKARIEVQVSKTEPGPAGMDEVVFALGPADGIPAQPLAKSASGGELSRVMLALEVIVSHSSRGTTLVFDEVDAGVGGRAAVEIGRRLAKLALNNQVIVVTHLPQVAAYADAHVHISKDVTTDSVSSQLTSLDEAQRVAELSRMLAGLDDTETGRAHAAELLSRATAEKAEFAAS